jgi:hypothetical protein
MFRPQVVKVKCHRAVYFLMTVYARVGCADVKSLVARSWRKRLSVCLSACLLVITVIWQWDLIRFPLIEKRQSGSVLPRRPGAARSTPFYFASYVDFTVSGNCVLLRLSFEKIKLCVCVCVCVGGGGGLNWNFSRLWQRLRSHGPWASRL